jgi:antitoxin ParD1/3/4
MRTRNVVLTEHQQNMIETLVGSGRYQNASEVLRDGLRLVEQRETLEAAKLQALREAVGQGWRDLEAGRYSDFHDDALDDFIGQLGRRAGERVHGRT